MSFIFLCFYYDLYVYGCCAVYQLKTVVYKGNLICPEDSEKIHFVRNPYNKLAVRGNVIKQFNHLQPLQKRGYLHRCKVPVFIYLSVLRKFRIWLDFSSRFLPTAIFIPPRSSSRPNQLTGANWQLRWSLGCHAFLLLSCIIDVILSHIANVSV